MKKSFALFFVLLVHLTVNAQTRDYTFRNAAPDEGLTVERNTRSGMQMRHALKQISIANITDNGFTGDVVMGGKGISLPANEGEPNLPAYSRFVAIPNGATAHVEMGYRSMTIIENVDLLPAPPIKADTDDSPSTYEKKPSVYNKDAFFPERPVTVSEPFSLRGVQTVTVSVVPYQYNPVTKELRVYDDLQFDVRFDGGNGTFGDSRLRSPYWDPILMQSLANYNQLPTVDYEARMQQWVNTRATGCEYLIVIPNNESFRTYANQLRDYRIQQGILTEVKSLSEMGCTTIDQMKSWFRNAYNNWDIPPVAVLLFGDHNTNMSSGIPAETVSHPSTTTCISDNGYADVTGDNLPEMAFSRLVAANASEAQVMVSKQIEYEYTNPNMDAYSYDHPVTALGWQTDRWFQLCSEVVGGYWRQQGKHPLRINTVYSGIPGAQWSTNANTPSVVSYFGPEGVGYIPLTPAELGGWMGGITEQVQTAINNGTMMIQHRDHGAYDGWGEPYYRIRNVAGLTNVGKLTFVNTINCKTGAFDYSEGCFIEALMRHTYNNQNAGAVGCLGPTETSYSFCNDAFAWGMYDQFDPQFLPDYGPYANYEGNWRPAFGNVAGKYFLRQSSWPYNKSTYEEITDKMFTAHCDAFLRLYTKVPEVMNVSYPAHLLASSPGLTLTAPAGAVISLTYNNQILAVATATGSSQTIAFPTQPVGTTMTLVITKQDYQRFVATVSIVNGPLYDISVAAHPEEGGRASGAGSYASTPDCVLTATANPGYDFVNWTHDGEVVSEQPVYSFSATAEATYTANFIELFPHDVQCVQQDHGFLSADKNTATKYEIVHLTATPEPHYYLASFTVTKKDDPGTSVPVVNGQFTMPDFDVAVSAEFEQGYTVNVANTIHGVNRADVTCAPSGTIVNLMSQPNDSYYFDSWRVFKSDDMSTNALVTDNQFILPEFDVTVMGIYNLISEEEIAIGTFGTTDTHYYPTYGYYKYTLSQQIFTAEEIQKPGTITHISIKVTQFSNGYDGERKRKYDIYLKHVDKELFESNSDWVQLTNADRVVKDKEVTYNAVGWYTIKLDNNFVYDGESNLVLCVHDKTGQAPSHYPSFSTYPTGYTTVLYHRRDNAAYDPTSLGSLVATGSTARNNQVIFTMTHSGSNAALAVAPGQAEFSCVEGEGGSEPLLVNVVGSLLDENVTLTMPEAFEVSSSVDGPYSQSLVLNQSNHNVGAIVYVRLKSGLCQGNYEGTMTLTSGEHELTADLSGEVFGKLVDGWNWWAPTKSMSLADLKQALGTSGALINSQNAGFLRYENSTWSGTLTNLSLGQMYRIQASAPVALRLSGTPASDINVSLTQGYNWFGYTGTQPLAIDDLIVSPGPSEGDRIIDKEGVSVTFTNGAWNGEFTLVPGKGYVYVSNGTENKTIIFP